MSKPQKSAVRRASKPLVCLAVLAGATALSACDPGYGIDGRVVHADPSLAGHVLVVTVYREASLGTDGYPVASEAYPPELALATRVDGTETSFQFSTLGCNENVRVVAWVDADDSEGLEERIPQGTTLDGSGSDAALADRIAAARPGPGDWEAISIAFDFADGSSACEPDHAKIALEVQPRT